MTKAEEIWLKINGSRDGDAGVFCIACLLAAAAGDLRPSGIVRASGLSASVVKGLWRRARKVGLIKGGRLRCNWLSEPDGALAIVLDSLVLQGRLKRV